MDNTGQGAYVTLLQNKRAITTRKEMRLWAGDLGQAVSCLLKALVCTKVNCPLVCHMWLTLEVLSLVCPEVSWSFSL